MEPSSAIVGPCLEHPDKSGTPCSRCGTFRCPDCMTGSALCPPCRQSGLLHPPAPEDTVGFGPRVGGRLIDVGVGFFAGIGGGIVAGITLVVMQAVGAVSPGWAGRINHGLAFSILSGLTAGVVGGALSTWVCGASVGKALLKLRVVDTSGKSPRLGGALLRELAYVIDSFFFGLVAKSAMDGSPLQQRIGDRWGDTAVVRRDAASQEALAPTGRMVFGLALGFFSHMLVVAAFTVLGAL